MALFFFSSNIIYKCVEWVDSQCLLLVSTYTHAKEHYISYYIALPLESYWVTERISLNFAVWKLSKVCISSYSVQMRKNADQNNSEYDHFLRKCYKFWKFQKQMLQNSCITSEKDFIFGTTVSLYLASLLEKCNSSFTSLLQRDFLDFERKILASFETM